MATVPPEQWRPFSEYLDQALDLPDADRAAWLAALAQSNPQLAAAVADALSQRERRSALILRAPVGSAFSKIRVARGR
jgi:hypothetical protein